MSVENVTKKTQWLYYERNWRTWKQKGQRNAHAVYDKTIPFNGFCQQARLKLLPKRNLEAFAKLARRAAMGYIGAR